MHIRRYSIEKLASLVTVVAICLVLAGWYLDIAVLTSGLSGFPPMNPVAAITFLMAALALYQSGTLYRSASAGRTSQWITLSLAMAVVAIGALKLMVTDQWTSVDEWLFYEKLSAISRTLSGRMAHSTAVNFILLGLALFFQNIQLNKGSYLVIGLVIVLMFISSLALVGYLYQIQPLSEIIPYLPMPFNAACLFIMLGLGILWLIFKREKSHFLFSNSLGGRMARNLLPLAFFFPLLIGKLCLVLQSQIHFDYKFMVGLAVVGIIFIFSFLIYLNSYFLDKVDAERISQQQFLEAIAFTIPETVYVYVYDMASGKVIYTNREIATDLGYVNDATEPARQADWLMNFVHPEDSQIVEAHLRALAVAADKNAHIIEYRVKHKQGTDRWLSNRATVFARNAEGEVTQILGSIQDITSRKLDEEKINDLLQETQGINEELANSEEELRYSLKVMLELNRKVTERETSLAHAQRITKLGSWERDMITNLTLWSDQLYRNFGLEPGEVVARSKEFLSRVHPDDLIRVKETLAEADRTFRPYSIEFRMILPTGEVRTIYGRGDFIVNEKGEVAKIFGTCQDITERKQAEIALRESEDRYRKLVDLLPDTILLTHKGLIIYSNKAGIKMFGAKVPGQLLGSRFLTFVHPDYHEKALNTWQELILGKEKMPVEAKLVRLDHSELDAELSGVPLSNDGSKGSLLFIRDITERKRAVNALLHSEQFFKALFQNSSDFVQTINAEGRILYQSPTFYRLNGYQANEREGQSIFELIHPEQTAAARLFLQQLLENPAKSQSIQVKILHKDGHWRWIESTATNLLHEPVVKAMVLNNRDITERKLAEEQLKQQNHELRKINAELDRFVYRASHDLRAPLSSLLGLITITKMESSEETKAQYLQMMEKSIGKLDTFIQSIINYSRNARLEITGQPVDFQEMFEETFEDLKYMAQSGEIARQLSITGESPFFSDVFRLKIIFNNIISNAIRYSNPRIAAFIHIRITIDEQYAFIEFEDNGCGIAEESIDKIFEMFYRASQGNVGSGLGLYIVKEVVDTLHGKLQVHSQFGKGTTFQVKLPNLKVRQQVGVSD
ncbi:MAG: PAS domain S-box protein [Bacteroidota bacterium]